MIYTAAKIETGTVYPVPNLIPTWHFRCGLEVCSVDTVYDGFGAHIPKDDAWMYAGETDKELERAIKMHAQDAGYTIEKVILV